MALTKIHGCKLRIRRTLGTLRRYDARFIKRYPWAQQMHDDCLQKLNLLCSELATLYNK